MIEISKETILIAAVIWLLVCSLNGYYKGFLREAYTLVQIVIAIVCIYSLARHISIFADGISGFGGFLVIFFILRWIGKLLDIVNHIPILGGINRTFGVLLGFVKGLVVLGLLYYWLGSRITI